MNRPDATPPAPGARDTQADGRDGRVVGDNDDGPLDSLGKAILAPVEGADEGADTRPDRPFGDLTRPLPQGEDAPRDPTLKRRE
jgi:hypothetical protein